MEQNQPSPVVVTGARGSQQGAVLRALSQTGRPVIATSRAAGDDMPGVRWVEADLGNPASLASALEGASGLSFHLPVSAAPWPVEQLIELAADKGIQHVVFNAGGPTGDPAMPAHHVAETLKRGDTSATVFEPTLYLENLLLPFIIEDLAKGTLRYPLPADAIAVAWLATDDIGTLSERAFRGSHAGHFYVAGPEAVTGRQLAERIGEGLGTTIAYEQLPIEAFQQRLAPIIGEAAAGGVSGMYAAMLAHPEAFQGWLAPDLSKTAETFDHRGTTVAEWSRRVLAPMLGRAS